MSYMLCGCLGTRKCSKLGFPQEWFLAPSGFDDASKVSNETEQDTALSIRTWAKHHYLLLGRDYSDKSLSREMFT